MLFFFPETCHNRRCMCGIAGFIGGAWPQGPGIESTLATMARRLKHRGPDHSGMWTDRDCEVAFVHNRLAIIDLSPAGNQPMTSPSGRYVIVYNGELYDHQETRADLAAAGLAPSWRGHSDTETLLAAIDAWGTRGALERSTGMFAFALWDKAERTLTLARDRLGEKPLYYGRQKQGGPFLFGSELKALAAHPEFEPRVDRGSLGLLLRYNFIPAPHSIYQGIRKLPPGTILTFNGTTDPVTGEYWSGAKVAERGVSAPLAIGDEDAVDELERRLEAAISGQLMADVPLGAFLSGGIDSSTIVALMQKLSARPVKTFTIGFRERGFNEAEQAKAVARHLGTDHSEVYVTPQQARDVIPLLPRMFDEPFADASQIPTHLVSALAREQVKVSLSGDGGDELFAGYTRYQFTSALWRRIGIIPGPLRAAAARAISMLPSSAWDAIGEAAAPILPKRARIDRAGDRLHKGAPLLSSRSDAELYAGVLTLWRDVESVVIGTGNLAIADGRAPSLSGLSGIERMMAFDLLRYLPDDILVKVDRAAMAVSLETRVPFLDHRLVEFAWRLPFRFKVRDGETKWILRQLLYRYVPKPLIERPKMGFGVPIGEWLRGPLREWAAELLDERRLADEGYFHPQPIVRIWRAHLGGSVDEQYRLWGILMFQSWLESSRNDRLVDEPATAAFA
jgi:asparagine synthase (glutamine-hydrolysing)